ncbi:hypothetical protein FBF91_08000 [Campylobacter upsaliensis]|uniref:hypothetical protein n=1 Tax=Campylobacter upsaliensis TaxID=28080 RepID=UPI0012C85BC9|nr:hypothetical protein [Campylobacter upsaliensis]EAK7296939.1 hypothetical protein [Campylobacter upsaliensis]MBJ6809624.1 hypothetical protein [Campylobacter upsaliensis]
MKKKLLGSLAVVSALMVQGCAVEAMNAFQLVGSAVQGGLAMSGSIAEANENEKMAKLAENNKTKVVELTPAEKEAKKLRDDYFVEYNKLAHSSDLYCKEQWKHHNKCVSVANGKVLSSYNMHATWSNNNGWQFWVLDDRTFKKATPTDQEFSSVRTGGLEFYSQQNITDEKFRGYRRLGKGVTINDFKANTPEFGGMRPSAVLKAVKSDLVSYYQLMGI